MKNRNAITFIENKKINNPDFAEGVSIAFQKLEEKRLVKDNSQLVTSKYVIGMKLRYTCQEDLKTTYDGTIVPNYKLPGDICVDWENGIKSSYDEEWLDEFVIIINDPQNDT